MKISEIKENFFNASKRYVSDEEARYFSEEVVETSIRKSSAGKYDKGIVEDIKSWEGKAHEVKKTIDLPGYTQFDFEGRGPSIKLKEIHDELERKAKENGIAMVSIINSGGMHAMHLWTQGLAKRGLFSLGSWNGGPDAVVPFNGTKGLLGTNPFTYGFPGDKGDIVVDMATSEIPYFKIVKAKKENEPLPVNTAVDSRGEVTTDPNEAFDENEISNLLPIGGDNYKGYNINYLMEVMTSALIGAQTSSEMSDAYIETEHGGFLIAISIDRVTNRDSYDKSLEILNADIRSQTPRQGVSSVQVPGDRNLSRKERDETEIEVSAEFVELLKELEYTVKN